MSNYPDGCPGPRHSVAEYSCLNPKCEQSCWEVEGIYDLGSFEPDREEDTKCPSCGEWGE